MYFRGHNGVKSIIESLGGEKGFKRVLIGIGSFGWLLKSKE